MKTTTDIRVELAEKLQRYDYTYDDHYANIKLIWKQYFDETLQEIDITDQKAKDILFYEFTMQNWNAMHRENTEYKTFSRRNLYQNFSAEASYISDRISLDRLFRTHWMFRQVFYDELIFDEFPEFASSSWYVKHWPK